MSNFLVHPFTKLTKEEVAKAIKAQTARQNALKSTGPKSPEGKAIAARNAFKHGFAGAKLIIDESEREAFSSHIDAYFDRFKPQDQVEADAVRRIADARWKMDIISATEGTIMELEGGFQMCLVDAKLDETQVNLNYYRALAIVEQSEGRAIDLCHRYYTQTAREFDRALRSFYKLREERPNDAKEIPIPDLEPKAVDEVEAPEQQQQQQPRADAKPVKKPNEAKVAKITIQTPKPDDKKAA
jgi:hypothetical protein